MILSLFHEDELIQKVKIKPWFPESLKDELRKKGKIKLSCRFTKAERKVFRKEKFMWPSEWAEKHRIVTNSSMPGAWRNSNTQYLAGIMDSAAYPYVNEIIVRKCSQSGVTESAINYLGYVSDRDPGPAMFVFADENTAKDNSNDRIQPMYKSSTRLMKYRTGNSDDETATRINLNHMTIYLGWASSSSRLANKPIRYGFTDEVDKPGYQKTKSQGETSGLNLFEKRLKTYKLLSRHKWWIFSTPTTEKGNISVKIEEANVLFEYNVKCPECGAFHIMQFENIKWEGGRKADPKEMEEKLLAWYECPMCNSKWDERARDKAVLNGHWIDTKKSFSLHSYIKKYRPRKVGFQLPAWITPFSTFSEIAAKWIRGLRDPDQMKDHFNDHRALPYTGAGQRTIESLEKLRDFRPPRLVPGNNQVAGLTAGIDTQDDGFYFEIRAWGWGIERDSWQIRHGFVTSFSALQEVLWQDKYYDADGNEYMIHLAVQDAMGHNTAQVYDFCAVNRGLILPFQGKQTMQRPYKYSVIETYPGTNKPIPGGIQLLQANVTYYKNLLARHMSILPEDPGQYRFHSETTEDWFAMLIAEYQDEHGFWQCPSGKPNHGFDCAVYSLIAADVLNIRYWEQEEEEVETTQVISSGEPKVKRRRKAW